MDTSWIIEEEKLANLNQSCSPESMEYITIELLYIDIHKNLKSKDYYHIKFDEAHYDSSSNAIITKEQLISLSQKYKKSHNNMTQYLLKDILLFHIPISQDNVSDFVDDEIETEGFFQSCYPIKDDIRIPRSIFVFHSCSTLFFIFCEEEKIAVKQLKSVLKDPSSSSYKRHLTKRVRIKAPRHTRRDIRPSD